MKKKGAKKRTRQKRRGEKALKYKKKGKGKGERRVAAAGTAESSGETGGCSCQNGLPTRANRQPKGGL